MAKQVILSFDDGRLDTYNIAFSILQKHNLKCTVNISSDFVNNPEKYNFDSSNGLSVTPQMISDMEKCGNEIALHGHKHNNTVQDIRDNLEWIKKWGISTNKIGFASPKSYITENNIFEISELIKDNTLTYVRSGIQTRREGLSYSVIQFLQEKTHSSFLFSMINKRLIIQKDRTNFLLKGVSITKNTTVKQIKKLLSKLKDGQTCILIFHSILDTPHQVNGTGKWCWDSSRFDELCSFLSSLDEYKVIRTIDLFMEK